MAAKISQTRAEATATRPGRVAGLASLGLGVGSIILSHWLLAYLVFAYSYFHWSGWASSRGQTWRMFVFNVTGEWVPVTILVGTPMTAATLGLFGLSLVRMRDIEGKKSMVSIAARFSTWGLVGSCLDTVAIASLFAFRLLS